MAFIHDTSSEVRDGEILIKSLKPRVVDVTIYPLSILDRLFELSTDYIHYFFNHFFRGGCKTFTINVS